LAYLDRWDPAALGLESEAEIEMARILEMGPGTDSRAVFARVEGWHQALKAVASEPSATARSKLIVLAAIEDFPSAEVSGSQGSRAGRHRCSLTLGQASPGRAAEGSVILDGP
jgi:hypothetical protein